MNQVFFVQHHYISVVHLAFVSVSLYSLPCHPHLLSVSLSGVNPRSRPRRWLSYHLRSPPGSNCPCFAVSPCLSSFLFLEFVLHFAFYIPMALILCTLPPLLFLLPSIGFIEYKGPQLFSGLFRLLS